MKNIIEERHYTVKLVDKLPKRGNSNWLYGIDGTTLDKVYRWNVYTKQYIEISLGGSGSGSSLTAAEVKALYESNADTNAFTDADKTKLDSTTVTTPASIKSDYESNADTNAFTDAEKAKLAAIEAGATGDQTGAEIKALYEAEADTNAFTDAEQTKLTGIESGATADQIASEVPFTPTGNIISVNTQDAIAELEQEINIKVNNIEVLTAGESLVPNEIVYLNPDGKYYKADNSTVNTTKGDLRICLDTIAADATGRFALQIVTGLVLGGEIIGDRLYLGTAGGFINTVGRDALTTGFQSRNIGFVDSQNRFYFSPETDYFQIA